MLNNQLSVKFERGWSYGSWKKVTMRDKKQIQEENKLTTKLVKDQSSQFLNKFLWKCWLVKINKWSKKFFFFRWKCSGNCSNMDWSISPHCSDTWTLLELQDHQDAGRDQNHSADTKLGLLSEDQCYKTHSCLPECIALYKNYAVPRLKLGS